MRARYINVVWLSGEGGGASLVRGQKENGAACSFRPWLRGLSLVGIFVTGWMVVEVCRFLTVRSAATDKLAVSLAVLSLMPCGPIFGINRPDINPPRNLWAR